MKYIINYNNIWKLAAHSTNITNANVMERYSLMLGSLLYIIINIDKQIRSATLPPPEMKMASSSQLRWLMLWFKIKETQLPQILRVLNHFFRYKISLYSLKERKILPKYRMTQIRMYHLIKMNLPKEQKYHLMKLNRTLDSKVETVHHSRKIQTKSWSLQSL